MHPEAPRLDPAGLRQMRETFLAVLGNFGDFDDVPSEYHRTERAYKEEAARLVRTHLPRALFGGDAGPVHDQQVAAATLRTLTTPLEATGATQNIIGWRYVDFLRQMDAAERSVFAAGLGTLLYGDGESPERVDAFVHAMWPAWRRTQGGNPFALSRIFPTYYLMLLNPRSDLAARTDLLTRAARMLLPASLLRSRPLGAEDYRRVLGFGAAVRTALQRWGWNPHDMIDVHSFLWVGTRTAADLAQLTDLPEEDA